MANSVDTWFVKLEDTLRKMTMPEELANTSVDAKSSQSGGQADNTDQSAKARWTHYQLGHGGAVKDSRITPCKSKFRYMRQVCANIL